MRLDWEYVQRYTGLMMQHLDIHKNKAGCCCVLDPCLQCPTHSMDLRYQDMSLSHWPVKWEPPTPVNALVREV